MTSLVQAGFVLELTETDAKGDRLSGSARRLRGIRLSCSQGQVGSGVTRSGGTYTCGNLGFSGEDFITHRRNFEVLGACLGKTQASCAFQMVAAGGKYVLGRSSDKTMPSLKNTGDTCLLASLCL